MSVRLVILGLLRDKPLYGYEIKQLIEEHMGDWTSIAIGSIYFAIDKLAEEKFIENVGIEKSGKRPSRSVYQITKQGKKEFQRLLRDQWQKVERDFYPLDICLFFIDSLPAEETRTYLINRRSVLQVTLQHIRDHQEEEMTQPGIPPIARAIFEHSIAHTQAEVHWLNDLLEKTEGGLLP